MYKNLWILQIENMPNLLETLNISREETILKHHGAAVAELKSRIESEPLRTEFYIYSGCVSEEITKEIAHRLNNGGVKAVPSKSGTLIVKHYLTVSVELPEQLVHEKDKDVVETPEETTTN